MNGQDSDIQNWQQARRFFENHLNLSLSEVLSHQAFIQLDQDVKDKVRQLFGNKFHELTLLEQPEHVFRTTLQDADLSGSRLGSYELIELLAHGGMSSVYRARKAAVEAQKDVAIKLIPSGLLTPQTAELFKTELSTLSRLYHPNIIGMHHGDVADNGTPYLVMELIEDGSPIDAYCHDRQLSPHAIVELFVDLCGVMNYAHQNSIIHQDLKPSNVLVDQHGHLKVLDFGVAALSGIIPEHQGYTAAYAPPEQRRNDQHTSPATDTYALCALLLKCLTGQADQDPDWQTSALKNAALDADLCMVLRKGLAEQVEDRYASAYQLAMDLNQWRQKLPIRSLNNNLLYRFRKLLQRQPVTSALAALSVLAVITGLLFYQQQYHIAATESANARQIKQLLLNAIEQTDPDISLGEELTVKDMLHQVEINTVDEQLSDPLVRQELLLTLGQAFFRLGDYDSADNKLKRALNNQPDDPAARLHMAELALARNDSSQAQDMLNALADQQTTDMDPGQRVEWHILKARTAVMAADFQTAQVMFTQASQLAEQVADHDLIIRVMIAKADSLLEQDQMDQAIELTSQALDRRRDELGTEHPATLKLQAKLAEMYLSSSGERVQLAVEMFNNVLPPLKRIMGQQHPLVAKTQFLLSTAYRSLNQLDQARQLATEALTTAMAVFGEDHVFAARIMMSLGGTLLAQGELDEAISHATQAVAIYNQAFGAEHHETLQYKTALVAMLVKNNQYQQALDELLHILPIQQKTLGAEHRGTLYVEIILSKTYTALERFTDAIEVGERCLQNATGGSQQNIMEVYCALALEDAYFQNGQYQQALGLIETYQNDPLITQQPVAAEQFNIHKSEIMKKQQTSSPQ
jgi:serine/threonine protein kinase